MQQPSSQDSDNQESMPINLPPSDSPPPIPQARRYRTVSLQAQEKSPGRPWGIASVVVAALGCLPLLVYGFNCLIILESPYQGNLLLIVGMGFLGFFVHVFALIAAIVAMSMRSQALGMLGLLGNGLILGIILIAGFVAIVF